MTVSFPSLKPATRSVQLGQYAVRRFTSIAGTGTSRVYGSQPFNASLSLEFTNISDLDALKISEAYEEARGSYDILFLPLEIWDGMDGDLRAKLERDYKWRFAEPPNIESSVPGFSSISVTLEGQRDG